MDSDYMKKHCRWCSSVLIQKKKEMNQTFSQRKYCDRKCRKRNNNYQAKLKDNNETYDN